MSDTSDMFDRYAAKPKGGMQYKRPEAAPVIQYEVCDMPDAGHEQFSHGARTASDVKRLLEFGKGPIQWNIQGRCGLFYSRLWLLLLPWMFLYAWREAQLFTEKVYGGLHEREGLCRLADLVLERTTDQHRFAIQKILEACKNGTDENLGPGPTGA